MLLGHHVNIHLHEASLEAYTANRPVLPLDPLGIVVKQLYRSHMLNYPSPCLSFANHSDQSGNSTLHQIREDFAPDHQLLSQTIIP